MDCPLQPKLTRQTRPLVVQGSDPVSAEEWPRVHHETFYVCSDRHDRIHRVWAWRHVLHSDD